MYKVTTGDARLGSGNIFHDATVAVLLAGALGVAVVAMLALLAVRRYSEKLRKFYRYLRKRLFWNAFIRFVFHSTLSL